MGPRAQLCGEAGLWGRNRGARPAAESSADLRTRFGALLGSQPSPPEPPKLEPAERRPESLSHSRVPGPKSSCARGVSRGPGKRVPRAAPSPPAWTPPKVSSPRGQGRCPPSVPPACCPDLCRSRFYQAPHTNFVPDLFIPSGTPQWSPPLEKVRTGFEGLSSGLKSAPKPP